MPWSDLALGILEEFAERQALANIVYQLDTGPGVLSGTWTDTERRVADPNARAKRVAANRLRRKRLRDEAKRAGRCVLCITAQAAPGRSMCGPCNERNTQQATRARMARGERQQQQGG